MSSLRISILVLSGLAAALSLGWLAYHYLLSLEQFARLILV